LNLEEENKKKRKNAPLTNSEWLTFSFFPFNSNSIILHDNDFNKTEDNRFEKFGFDRKLKESYIARRYGVIFYILITILIVLIMINFNL